MFRELDIGCSLEAMGVGQHGVDSRGQHILRAATQIRSSHQLRCCGQQGVIGGAAIRESLANDGGRGERGVRRRGSGQLTLQFIEDLQPLAQRSQGAGRLGVRSREVRPSTGMQSIDRRCHRHDLNAYGGEPGNLDRADGAATKDWRGPDELQRLGGGWQATQSSSPAHRDEQADGRAEEPEGR